MRRKATDGCLNIMNSIESAQLKELAALLSYVQHRLFNVKLNEEDDQIIREARVALINVGRNIDDVADRILTR